MLTVQRADIPEYLRNTDFYLSLNEEDDGEISVPIDCFKADKIVTDEQSLRRLFITLRFWGCNEILDEIYDVSQTELYFDAVADEFSSEFSYLSVLREFRPFLGLPIRLLTATNAGSLITMKYLVEKKFTVENRQKDFVGRGAHMFTVAAAHQGHIHCLKYLHSLGCEWTTRTCESAASGGRVECLKFARDNGCEWKTSRMVDVACEGGNIECLKYVLEHHCPITKGLIPNIVLKTDNIECLECLYAHGATWAYDFVLYAVINKGWKCLTYAHTHGCAVVDSVLYRLDSPEYLQIIHDSGYEWTVQCSANVVLSGKVGQLQYLRELGCPWDAGTCTNAVKFTSNIDCLRYAHENGCPWSIHTIYSAIRCKNKLAVAYMQSQGFPLTTSISAAAAVQGLEMVTFLHELGCPWDEATVNTALMHHHERSNQFGCVRYAVENGCPAAADVCLVMGTRGNLEMLKYFHSKGYKLRRFKVYPSNKECADYVDLHLPQNAECVTN